MFFAQMAGLLAMPALLPGGLAQQIRGGGASRKRFLGECGNVPDRPEPLGSNAPYLRATDNVELIGCIWSLGKAYKLLPERIKGIDNVRVADAKRSFA